MALAFQSSTEWVNVRENFGAAGDGVADDAPAIQAAIDYAIYTGRKRVVYLPSGTYRIGTTLHLGYGANPQFTSVTLMGDGPVYDHTQPALNGTVIVADFDDRMSINVQGARQTRIKGLTIVGQYDHIRTNNLGYAVNDDDWDEEEWKDWAFPAGAFAPTSIYAGITVDAYSGPQPISHYPDVNYPAWLGSVSQYNKAHSSDVLIEDVNILDFVACVAGKPCADSNNGEFIRWRGGVARGLYGWALGHSQSRLPACENVDFSQCYTAITGTRVGHQIGMMQGVYQGCHFGACYQIIDVSGGWSSSVALRDCYGEMIGRLGQSSATGDCTMLTLDNCTFDFREVNDERHGVPAAHTWGADCKLRLTNGTRFSTRYGFVTAYGGNTPMMQLDGVFSVMSSVVPDGLPASYEHGTGGFLNSCNGYRQYSYDVQSAFYRAGGQYWAVTSKGWNGDYAPWYAGAQTFLETQGSGWGARRVYNLPHPSKLGHHHTVTLANRSGRNVDIVGPNARYAYASSAIPLDLGDGLKIADAWFCVTGFDTDTVHLRQLTNYRLAAADSSFINKSQSDAPNAIIGAVYFSRVYSTSFLLAGSIASGTQVVTNVKGAMADGNQWNQPHYSGIAAGDYAILSEMPEAANIGGGSFNRLQQITALDTTAQTITFANYFPFAKSPAYLPFWLKTITP